MSSSSGISYLFNSIGTSPPVLLILVRLNDVEKRVKDYGWYIGAR